MNSLIKILSFAMTLVLAGCVANGIQNRIEDILPRDTFVKVIASATLEMCRQNEETKESECQTKKNMAYASGVIVKRTSSGSEILTAGHVCDTNDLVSAIALQGIKVYIDLSVMARNGETFKTQVVRIDPTIDSCIIKAPTMTRWRAIKIRRQPPEFGEKFYNLASPLGVATSELVPVLEGRYSGLVNFHRAAYTIPAAPGSSGSAIFDKRGRLVGMIHSVYRRFPLLSFSPSHEKLIDFLDH